jgi:hypothetical protein
MSLGRFFVLGRLVLKVRLILMKQLFKGVSGLVLMGEKEVLVEFDQDSYD